ncbi:MAG: hypothetical protein Q8L27_01090 [archaeon]|nr:hypothetical protein [archaeon]
METPRQSKKLKTPQETKPYQPSLRSLRGAGRDSSISKVWIADTRNLGHDHYINHPEDLQKLIGDIL